MSFAVNKKKKNAKYRTVLQSCLNRLARVCDVLRDIVSALVALSRNPFNVESALRNSFVPSLIVCLGCYIIRGGVTSARLTLLADRNCARLELYPSTRE